MTTCTCAPLKMPLPQRAAATATMLPLLLFGANIAWGSEHASALDLDLPVAPAFTGAAPFAASPAASGTDYEQVLQSRERARGGEVATSSGCPPAADGSERSVTGSYTTGIGYASRGGNSHWNAADINLCKERVGADGNVNTMNMRIHVGQYDGPGYIEDYGRGFGPGPYGIGAYGHPGIGGPWDVAPPRDASWGDGRRPWR